MVNLGTWLRGNYLGGFYVMTVTKQRRRRRVIVNSIGLLLLISTPQQTQVELGRVLVIIYLASYSLSFNFQNVWPAFPFILVSRWVLKRGGTCCRLRDQAEELPMVGGVGRNSVPTATAEDEHPPGLFSPF